MGSPINVHILFVMQNNNHCYRIVCMLTVNREVDLRAHCLMSMTSCHIMRVTLNLPAVTKP